MVLYRLPTDPLLTGQHLQMRFCSIYKVMHHMLKDAIASLTLDMCPVCADAFAEVLFIQSSMSH